MLVWIGTPPEPIASPPEVLLRYALYVTASQVPLHDQVRVTECWNPVPVSEVLGVLVAVLVTAMLAENVPTDGGVNVIVNVTLCWDPRPFFGSVMPLTVKRLALIPVIGRAVMFTLTNPVFRMTKECWLP